MPDEELSHGLVRQEDVAEDLEVDVGGLVDEGVPFRPRRRFLIVSFLFDVTVLVLNNCGFCNFNLYIEMNR